MRLATPCSPLTACVTRPRRWRWEWRAPLQALAWLLLATPALAGNDIYFVTYSHRVERGEAELMLMNDVAKPANAEGDGAYLAHIVELEFGVSERWATEVMAEGFFDPGLGVGRFTGFRWENRYRLLKGENSGLNPVLYVEYEDLDPATRYKMELSGREDGN